MSKFIAIKMVKKDENSRQYLFKRLNLSLVHDTHFDDYLSAVVYSENFENSHVILDEDFEHYMDSLDLIARTTKAKEESLCTG